jgi:hypothetical protein
MELGGAALLGSVLVGGGMTLFTKAKPAHAAGSYRPVILPDADGCLEVFLVAPGGQSIIAGRREARERARGRPGISTQPAK